VNKILNRLILGGAQISTSKYGITNKSVLKKNEIKKIFDFAQTNNIKFIDTAKSYKNSENIIGNSNKNFHVITKLSKFPSNQITYKKWIANQVFQSLKNLKTKKIYAILIHNMSKLNLKKLIKITKILNTFKKKKIVKFIGISIYDPEEIDFFWNSWKPDIIQVPYNIFDRRIETSGWLKILKKKKFKFMLDQF
jgi:aryl-alcohol dehydrogenase-like predicted oxidoreductase